MLTRNRDQCTVTGTPASAGGSMLCNQVANLADAYMKISPYGIWDIQLDNVEVELSGVTEATDWRPVRFQSRHDTLTCRTTCPGRKLE
jgi:hypothetical protein